MNKIRKGHMLLFITALLFYGINIVLSSLDILYFPLLISILVQALIFIPTLIYAAVKRVSISKMVRMKKTRPINFLMAILVLLCSYPVIIVLNMISMFFADNAVSDSMGYMMLRYGFWIPFFMVAIMPGFGEELLFRGALYGSYAKSRPLAGLFISAAAFGLMHGNFNQMPYAMVLGVVFVLMLEATDSIWVTMFMHFLLNGSNVILMYMVGPEMYLMSGENPSDSMRYLFASIVMEQGLGMFLGILAIYGLIALCFAAAAAALIYLTYQINHRSIKEIFSGRKVQPPILHKEPIFDFWLLGFVLVMIVVMIFT